jgi:uncharacterized membrane-anchored protein
MLLAAAALLVLGSVNHAIYAKERTIRSGDTIYLELAPVDPRSLMQGDYMALRFELAEQIEDARDSGALRGDDMLAPLQLDERRIARLAPLDSDPHIRFRIRDDGVWLGTNAYFFEEGSAERYTSARFGEFKLDRASGEAVLVGLRDEDLGAL